MIVTGTLVEIAEKYNLNRAALGGFFTVCEQLGVAKKVGTKSAGRGKPSVVWEFAEQLAINFNEFPLAASK